MPDGAYKLIIQNYLNLAAIARPDGLIMIFSRYIPSIAKMAVTLLLVPMLYCVVYPWKSLRTWLVTSCTSRMSICWRLIKASSITILVGDAMPIMFKVANLTEAIRSNCGWQWARGRRWFLYFVLIRQRHSRSIPRPFPSYSSVFFILSFYFGLGFVPDRPF